MNNDSESPIVSEDKSLFQIEILKIFKILKTYKLLLVSTISIGLIISLYIALSLPEVFRADMVIKSTETKNRSMFSQISNRLGGIAGSLGVNLDEGGSGGDYSKAVATLYSRVFLQTYIDANNLMPVLFPKDWDANTKSWKNNSSPPTKYDAYEEFVVKILLKRDEQTGIINFAVEWNNPVTASEIANDLIIELNNYLRNKEIENISSNIEYLEKELNQTSIVNAQAVVFKVIEEQTKAIMLANVTEEYAFEVIDPAIPPDERIRPSRRMIMLIGLVVTIFSSFTFIVLGEWLIYLRKILEEERRVIK